MKPPPPVTSALVLTTGKATVRGVQIAPTATVRARSAVAADPAPFVLAAALPLLFLHKNYSAGVSLPHGVDAQLGDFAVLAVVLAGLAVGRRRGFAPLRSGVLAAACVLLAWIFASVLYASARESWYPTTTHLVTAAKFAEYALLAFAIPLIVRRAGQLLPAAVVLVAWSAAATVFGLLQFVGLVDDLDHTPAGRRKPSFLGYHDFATLSALALVVGAVVFLFAPPGRARNRLALAAAVSGAAGSVLAGPLDGVLATFLALVALLAVGRRRGRLDLRRASVLAGVWVAILLGVLLMRSSAIDQGLRLIGVKQQDTASTADVQSYSQRALLSYIGLEIWLREPLLGVGWLGSVDEPAYGPELAAAHRRFSQPPLAYPSPQHPWGVQNAYVEALADMGVVGLAALVALFAAAVVSGLRRALRAPDDVAVVGLAGALAALVVVAIWNGYGFVAGIPLDAATWLAVGLAATAAALARRQAGGA